METETKQEIFSLLLADVRSRKLISGLQAAGLHSDDFYSGLTELILQKMGFEEFTSDGLITWYEETLEDLIDMDVNYFLEKQYDVCSKLYEQLMWRRLLEE